MALTFGSPLQTDFVNFRRNSSFKKPGMLLFEDEDCGFDEVYSPSLFTPVKSKADVTTTTPVIRKDLSTLFQDEDSGLGMDNGTNPFNAFSETPVQNLKRPLFDDSSVEKAAKRQRKSEDTPKLRKTLSFGDKPTSTCDDIKSVVNRLVVEEDLVSDGSAQLCLPTIRGKHQDLNNISPDTMASVLNGEYSDVIGDFHVIDCRYPYEYKGGHIKDAENIYTHDGILDLLHRQHNTTSAKRQILVFHCEFSSERGPKLCRYLRSKDRELNSENYPFLNYPEVYLLYGGYKEFFSNHKDLCDPKEYKPMLHGDHADDLRHFRSKSKSWTAGEKRRKRTQRLRY